MHKGYDAGIPPTSESDGRISVSIYVTSIVEAPPPQCLHFSSRVRRNIVAINIVSIMSFSFVNCTVCECGS